MARDIIRIKNPQAGNKIEDKIRLTLKNGENIIAIRATNGESASEEMIKVLYEPSSQAQASETIMPNLWLMAIGVSRL